MYPERDTEAMYAYYSYMRSFTTDDAEERTGERKRGGPLLIYVFVYGHCLPQQAAVLVSFFALSSSACQLACFLSPDRCEHSEPFRAWSSSQIIRFVSFCMFITRAYYSVDELLLEKWLMIQGKWEGR